MVVCVSDCKNITGNQIHPNLQNFVGVSSQSGCSMVGGIGAAILPDFVMTWTTTVSPQTITLPATSALNNFDIDWGDTNSETVTAANPTHEFAIAGTYTITVTGGGVLPAFSFNDGGDKLLINDVTQWGDVGFVDLTGAFYGCSNLDYLGNL